MSYDVALHDPATGDVCATHAPHSDGGTYCVGGTDLCELNITYNYAEVFGPLVRNLKGRTATETLPELMAFLARWTHAKPYERDYWAPTPGNAVKAIRRLVEFAEQHPEGLWRVT